MSDRQAKVAATLRAGRALRSGARHPTTDHGDSNAVFGQIRAFSTSNSELSSPPVNNMASSMATGSSDTIILQM